MAILASPTTIRTKLYENQLKMSGVSVLLPTQAQMLIIENAIRNVIAEHNPKKVRVRFLPILAELKERGADVIVLGCTELSVLFADTHDQTLIDPITLMTKELLL